jgi:hypothetical protein
MYDVWGCMHACIYQQQYDVSMYVYGGMHLLSLLTYDGVPLLMESTKGCRRYKREYTEHMLAEDTGCCIHGYAYTPSLRECLRSFCLLLFLSFFLLPCGPLRVLCTRSAPAEALPRLLGVR